MTLTHPDWMRTAAVYQLNTRQFTPEGTFRAAMEHLPRVRDLGVAVVWLMPVHPIGRVGRKGTLGSPYAVRDHYGVNGELGTPEDLRAFVDRAHDLGLKVILDWVANHVAPDHVISEAHPEWFVRDPSGEPRTTPWFDWTDVVDLDYARPGLWRYMTDAMAWWVREMDVDGFRCDVAGFVPMDLWSQVRRELDAIKPVFLLAEWEARDLHAAFDASYAWSWYDAVHRVAREGADLERLREYYAGNEKAWPDGAMRLTFVSNHDKNAWEGTQFEQFGDALEAAIVLSVVGDGLPLVYNGQEAGNPRRLAFFDKDVIEWREHRVGDLYRRLLALKGQVSALANGAWGAPMLRVPNDAEAQVLSFLRENERDGVFAVFNFSDAPRDVVFEDSAHHGSWQDAFSGAPRDLDGDSRLSLDAWGWRVMMREVAA
ncbi:MAG TPA: alpha-amylase family glycosyl hydrolase [Longimicrobiales bacterium]|nr:alpha-amylase family glycosyl hydrolase [Longimicrobiales bacterium]